MGRNLPSTSCLGPKWPKSIMGFSVSVSEMAQTYDGLFYVSVTEMAQTYGRAFLRLIKFTDLEDLFDTAGTGSKIDGDFVLKLDLHRRENDQRRRLLHSKTGSRIASPTRKKQ